MATEVIFLLLLIYIGIALIILLGHVIDLVSEVKYIRRRIAEYLDLMANLQYPILNDEQFAWLKEKLRQDTLGMIPEPPIPESTRFRVTEHGKD